VHGGIGKMGELENINCFKEPRSGEKVAAFSSDVNKKKTV